MEGWGGGEEEEAVFIRDSVTSEEGKHGVVAPKTHMRDTCVSPACQAEWKGAQGLQMQGRTIREAGAVREDSGSRQGAATRSSHKAQQATVKSHGRDQGRWCSREERKKGWGSSPVLATAAPSIVKSKGSCDYTYHCKTTRWTIQDKGEVLYL